MNRFLAILALSILLLSAACKKDDPTPPLEGTWSFEKNTYYNYDGAGQLTGTRTYLVGLQTYWEITADSIHQTQVNGSLIRTSYKLTRNGDSLRYDRSRGKIYELTDHKLVIRFHSPNYAPNPSRTEVEAHFFR